MFRVYNVDSSPFAGRESAYPDESLPGPNDWAYYNVICGDEIAIRVGLDTDPKAAQDRWDDIFMCSGLFVEWEEAEYIRYKDTNKPVRLWLYCRVIAGPVTAEGRKWIETHQLESPPY